MEALDLHITKLNDLRGACNPTQIEATKFLASRKTGLLNIYNNDNLCLIYCIAASLIKRSGWTPLQASNPESYKPYVELISTEGLEFPISINDISILEQANRRKTIPLKFRINVFREDLANQTIYLIRKSTYKDGKVINVLLVDYENNGMILSHFLLIESNTFFKKHYLKKNSKTISSYSKNIFCGTCLESFWSISLLDKHQKVCGKPSSAIIEFPAMDQNLSFTKTEYSFKRIYNGYADFESVLVKSKEKLDCTKCIRQEIGTPCNHSFSIDTEIHKPVAVGMVIIDRNGEIVKELYYSGEKVVEKFIEEVLNVEKELLDVTKLNKYMIITPEQEKYHQLAEICYICDNKRNGEYYPFSERDRKCHDHNHITGKNQIKLTKLLLDSRRINLSEYNDYL